MNRTFITIALAVFATTLFVRSVDPVLLKIAADVQVTPTTAALLSTAFALPYALVQPVLGAVADSVGKARVMVVCLAIGTLATLASALANDFTYLVAMRVVGGITAGGVFPTSVAIIGDLVPLKQRQIVISRILAAGMFGNLLGASLAGFIGDFFGWRGVFLVTGGIAALTFVPSLQLLREKTADVPTPLGFRSAVDRYREIFRNPLAKICFSAVFLDALALFGLFPYMGALLQAQGETRAAIVGIIIAGWGIGGICYALLVSRLLPRFGDRALMIDGGIFMGIALALVALQLPWPLQFLDFMLLGFAFYLMHGGIQVYVTELSTTSRSSALALHSGSFFLGQAAGPIVYGLGFAHIGTAATLVIAGLLMAGLGVWCAAMLRRPAKP
jgi:predicted MFS family arabinose efflux permease